MAEPLPERTTKDAAPAGAAPPVSLDTRDDLRSMNTAEIPLRALLRAGRFWRTRVHLGHLAVPVALPLFAVAVAWRFMLGPMGLIGELDTAESVIGLMARGMWMGGLPDLFVWGRPGMAALEPIGAAALFPALGEGAFALRLVPFIVGSSTLLGTLLLVSRWLGGRATVPAALLMLVWFPGLGALQARSLGGVAPGAFWGLMALGCASMVTLQRARRLSVPAGLMCGLALYGHPSMMPLAAAALGLVVVAVLPVVTRPAYMLVAGGHVIRFGIGLAAGLIPVLLGPGARSLLRLETGVPAWETVPSVETLGHFFEEMLGGRWAPFLVVTLVLLSVPGLVARALRRGVSDPGVRFSAGALAAAVLSVLQAMAASPTSAEEAGLRLLPLLVVLPILAATTVEVPRVELAGVLALAAMFVDVDPSRIPPTRESGGDVPVDAAVEWLDAHPSVRCHASAPVAYRVALMSAERHRCISVLGRDYVPGWRVDAAAGPRAYFFAPEELGRLHQLENDLHKRRLAVTRAVAGPFMVRITGGSPWPPRVPPVETEHGRRDRRALVDADLSTAVTARVGQPVVLDLVWPTSLSSVSWWQDVTALPRAPCRVRVSLRLADGRVATVAEQPLTRTCDVARRWSLWTLPSMEVKVKLPDVEAAAVLVEALDEGSVLAASEMRVVPRSRRGKRD